MTVALEGGEWSAALLKTCVYLDTCKNMPLEIRFVYLDKKGIYSTYKTYCIISVLLAT